MSDQRLEQMIGNLLRAGVLLSAAVVLAGGVWLLIECGHEPADYRHFQPPAAFLRSPARVSAGLAHPNPQDLIQFGLLLLIAIPVTRVIMCLIAFSLERDPTYGVMTLIVLAVLAYSLAIPHG
jgi:uncharacterized membrane protein